MYPYHQRIRQRITNGEFIKAQREQHSRIGECVILYFNTFPYTRPIRPHRYKDYPDVIMCLDVTSNQSGGFYKAFLNEKRLSKWELFSTLGIQSQQGRTLDWHLDQFEIKHPNFIIERSEIDVT